MRKEKAGIALIGCGGMAAHYRATYAAIPGAALRLVVDTNEALARSVAEELGASRYATGWREALAADIQLADISTPNHLHEEPAVALLESGRHVILQKPLAPTVAACQRIIAAAERGGANGAVYMSDLEDPLVWEWRAAIAAGQLGQVTGIRARYAHRGGLTPPAGGPSWRMSREQTGGGAFIQLSLHHINLACWLLRDTVESVMAYSENLACPHIEGDDTTICLVRFARTGVLGVFESAWNADGSAFSVYGTQASAHCHGTEGSAASGLLPRAAIPVSTLRGPLGPKNQHRAFVEACLRGTAPEVSLGDGLRDVAVAQAAYLSAQQGRRVRVTDCLSEAAAH